MSHQHKKNPANVVRGLKAAVHNPNVSEEAKQRDYKRLQEMGETIDTEDAPGPHTRQRDTAPTSEVAKEHTGPDSNRVLGGYKATLSNPHTSEAAKQHAEQVLEANNET